MKRTPPPKKAAVRCGIYTRKSTDEGLDREFNSLDAQREAGEAYVKSQAHDGWQVVPTAYDDGGFTGGNMDRPALKRLLADVEAGRIDVVVTYKVDRLSRSLLDFARLMETFDKHNVAFVSVTQRFDTATSMGRLVLNVLLSFAQFEREIISERTRGKIAATRRKGRWSGGLPPLGYDVDPVARQLVINPAEANRVRAIFDMFLEHGSLMPAVAELRRRRWVGKRWTKRDGQEAGGAAFDRTGLYRLLTNVVYVGKLRYKDEVHPGRHDAIDHWTLLRILATPDPSLPPRLIEAFHYVGDLATPECMDSLLAAIADRGVRLDLGPDTTPADVAVEVWLRCREVIEHKHGERHLRRRRSFEYYQSPRRLTPTGPARPRTGSRPWNAGSTTGSTRTAAAAAPGSSVPPRTRSSGSSFDTASRCGGRRR